MNPQVRPSDERSKSPSTEQPEVLSGDVIPQPGCEAWAHIPLEPKFEFQRKHESILQACFSADDRRNFGIAWTSKRVTEAYWDLGHRGFEEEREYADSTDQLYDSPGFKALPVAVQKEIREFLAIEPKPPRRFGPSIVQHYKLKKCVPVVPFSEA